MDKNINLTNIKKGGRHEIKHYINNSDCMELTRKLKIIAKPDFNSIENNKYTVRSLYFDNYNDKALFEKINGNREREKFRIRYYNNNTSFIRLEKKSKINGLCYKESAVITEDECKKILSGDISVLKENGDALLFELYIKMNYLQLRPKNIVEYTREAYVYPMGNVRVTIDSNIRYSNMTSKFLNTNLLTIPIPKSTILEVKYDAYLPEIIRNITSLKSRSACAYSKYAVSRII